MSHNDTTCTKYGEPVLEDENGNCSLCGAKLSPTGEEEENTSYDLTKDHTEIKQQIKEWEKTIDGIINCLTPKCGNCMSKLENLSNEMMAINL